MPAEIQTGKAILHGITNDGTAISISGYATFVLDTVAGNHKFELQEIKDENRSDVTLIATNGNVELDITWTPAGATRAAAVATVVFLTPLAKVTLAHYKVSAFNGDWVYIGDGKIEVPQGPAKLSLKVRKYDDSTQNASLTTLVTG